jgi:uncharacterized protein YjbI with pentapeptide repeats
MPPTWLSWLIAAAIVALIVFRHFRQRQADALLNDHARRRTSGEAEQPMSEWRAANRMLSAGDPEGLRRLEALGQETPKLRQSIVNQICVGLRGGVLLHGLDVPWRTTLQQALATHLRPGTGFWAGMNLTLVGAELVDLDLSGCRVRNADFTRSHFHGDSRFDSMTATGEALFEGVRFDRHASFDEALFAQQVSFRAAAFAGNASFKGIRVSQEATFSHARFSGRAVLSGAEFGDVAHFRRTRFGGRAYFTGAVFAKAAHFEHTWFRGRTDVGSALYADDAGFDGAVFGRRVPRADHQA